MNVFYDVMGCRPVGDGGKKQRDLRLRRCDLPCDRLSDEQVDALHGPVDCCNLRKPMTLSEFERLPQSMREVYFRTVVRKAFAEAVK